MFSAQHLRISVMFCRRMASGPTIPKFCIVGSGPAGFYCAQALLKLRPNCNIDVYEKLPVPFGLVRYGVAPDHPEVKNVINSFTSTAKDDRVSFFGNVTVGRDVTVSELLEAYHLTVICTGANYDNSLNIPGENLPNVFSARSFVGWYNGFPENSCLPVNLNVESAAVIGQGNVALDVARILLAPVDELRKTDISQHALDSLSKSKVKRVYIVGRRGPLQVSFTIKEFRELTKLAGCHGVISDKHISGLDETVISDLPRPRRRLTELILKQATVTKTTNRQWDLLFCRRPLKFVSAASETLNGVVLGINELKDLVINASVVHTNETEFLECGLVLKSIGYRSEPLEHWIPFNHAKGIIDNENGRVRGIPGLYCCGWVASGPIGVILSTINNSLALGQTVAEDINSACLNLDVNRAGSVEIARSLASRDIQVVPFSGWEKIDAEERLRGSRANKPREKLTNIKEMLAIAYKQL